jgi:hypothetical protein
VSALTVEGHPFTPPPSQLWPIPSFLKDPADRQGPLGVREGSPCRVTLYRDAASCPPMSQNSPRGWNPWKWSESHFMPRTGIPVLIGCATMAVVTAALSLTTIGFYRGPCYPGTACGFIPYSVFTASEVLAMFALSALPLLVAVDSRPASRALGILGSSGVVVIGWASIFWWGARFTYGDQLIFVNADADTPGLFVWLLGALMAGAAIAIFGCLRRFRDSRGIENTIRGQATSH